MSQTHVGCRAALTSLLLGSAAFTAFAPPVAAQEPAPPAAPSSTGPLTSELIEDLRILGIVNALKLTREQLTQLAAVADSARDGLATIEKAHRQRLDEQRTRLLDARGILLRGGNVPAFTENQVLGARQAAQVMRAQKTEELIAVLSGRVRRILTRHQAAFIEDELAPEFEQPWRRYAGAQPAGPSPSRTRMPVDPGWWLKELRDLRVDSAEGDPETEIKDFGRKFTRGLPSSSTFTEPGDAQARDLARQVLAMPDAVFNRQERDLARSIGRQQLQLRNQQRAVDGKPAETFDPARWLTEEVLLSPRASVDLGDKVGR